MAAKPASAKNWVKSHRLLSVLVLVLLILGGFLVYRQYSIAQERQRFEQARASIDELYTEIVATAGEPDKSERSQSCGYASRKFDRGPRSCSVRVQFVYGVTSNEDASNKFNQIRLGLKKKSDIFLVTYSNEQEVTPFKKLKANNDEKEAGISTPEKRSGLSCSMRLIYAKSDNDSHFIISTTQPESLSASISCYGDAKEEHYPVRSE